MFVVCILNFFIVIKCCNASSVSCNWLLISRDCDAFLSVVRNRNGGNSDDISDVAVAIAYILWKRVGG